MIGHTNSPGKHKHIVEEFIVEKSKISWPYPWSALAYGNGVWVAVANHKNGYASYSTDGGSTWTGITISAAHPWTDIIYANNMFVTVGATGTTNATGEYPVAWSTDGANWSYESNLNSISTELSSIVYGNGRFVAFNTNGSMAAYSTDLETWSLVTLPTDPDASVVEAPLYSAYGNGIFVTVGNCRAMSSVDGEIWSLGNMGVNCTDVCFGAGKFVAISDGGYICYSEDGTTWTPVFLGDDEIVLSAITYGDNGFIALKKFSTEAYFSEDGVNWTVKTVGQIEPWSDIAFGDGKYMAVNNTQYNVYTFTFGKSSDFVTQSQFDNVSSFQKIAEKAQWYDGDLDYLNAFTESGFYPLGNFTATGQTTGTNNYSLATSSESQLLTFKTNNFVTQIISSGFSGAADDGPFLLARTLFNDVWSSVHKIITTDDTNKTFPSIDIGSYTGGGTDSVEITTGFAPKFILIYCVGTAYSSYKAAFWLKSSSKKQSNLCRLDYPSQTVSDVITTTSTGFTVAGSSSPYMNYSGAVHVYLALRG